MSFHKSLHLGVAHHAHNHVRGESYFSRVKTALLLVLARVVFFALSWLLTRLETVEALTRVWVEML